MEEKEATLENNPEQQAETAEPINEEPEFNVIDFFGLLKEGTIETAIAKIEEKLNLKLLDMQEALSKSLLERAEEMTLDMVNIAPYANYEKLIEDNDGMADFLKNEAHKPNNWGLYHINSVKMKSDKKDIISLSFYNVAVDDGTVLEGIVYVSKNGKILHAFPQVKS